MNISLESHDSGDSIHQRWINLETGLPYFYRFNSENLEERTVAAAALVKSRFFPSVAAAARAFKVSYKRLLSRVKGANPRSQNGGNNTLFSLEEE